METTHWINGQSTASSEDNWAEIISPVDGECLGRVALGTALGMRSGSCGRPCGVPVVEGSQSARPERTLLAVAGALRDEFKRLIEIECRTGKSAALATNELTMSIDYFDFYAGLLRGFTGSTIDVGPSLHISTRHQPYGVVAAIATWNAPLAMVTRNVSPRWQLGTPSWRSPRNSRRRPRWNWRASPTAAGLPAGLLNVVTGTVSPAGVALVDHDLVRKIHFTGSVEAGRKIGEAAARRVVPATLELGGKSPNIVFADANLERASQFAGRNLHHECGTGVLGWDAAHH